MKGGGGKGGWAVYCYKQSIRPAARSEMEAVTSKIRSNQVLVTNHRGQQGSTGAQEPRGPLGP